MVNYFINKFPFSRISFWLVFAVFLFVFIYSNQSGNSVGGSLGYAGISVIPVAIFVTILGVRRNKS